MDLSPGQLRQAFERRLVILLGERDNGEETRGHLRESAEVLAQGEHRLARGRNFHLRATSENARLGFGSNWALQIVPGTGHDFLAMGNAAADYLYGAR